LENSFKSLPRNWVEKRISNIANISVGKDVKEASFSKKETETYKFPVFSNTVDNYGLYGYYDFPEYNINGLTIVGRGAGLGTAFPRKAGFGAIGRLLVLSPKNNDFDTRYLSEYINNRFRLFHESGGIPQLPGITLGKYKVVLPPLPEQRAIADILGTWDAAIEKMERLITAKEKRFKAKSEQMISRDFHHDEFLLGDICEIFTANSKTSEIIPDGKFIIADMGAVSEKGELLNRKRSVNNKDQLNIGDLIMPKDDIGGGNIIGKVAYVDNDRVVLGDHVYALRFTENINSKFLFYQINGQRINRQLRRMSNGTSQLGLGKKDVKKQKIYLPDIDEQNKVVEILDNLKKEITLIEQIKEYYKSQKHGLMQKLLTGVWRVKV
jgi:type I restriction enzyme S subunit